MDAVGNRKIPDHADNNTSSPTRNQDIQENLEQQQHQINMHANMPFIL
jgi:hypothetical protein